MTAAPARHHAPPDALDLPEIEDLTHRLLEDWDNPVMSTAAICRAHAITPARFHALTTSPKFIEALASTRAITAARRPDMQARAHQLTIERLLTLSDQAPTNATHTKEIRLALKQLLALVDNPHPTPTPKRPDRNKGDDPHTQPQTPDHRPSPESPDRKGGDGVHPRQLEDHTTHPDKPESPPDHNAGDDFHPQQLEDQTPHQTEPPRPTPAQLQEMHALSPADLQAYLEIERSRQPHRARDPT